MLQLSGLKKRFKQHQALKGIDLTVQFGEVLGIIGASGSGKSTLLRCIDFLEIPDSGTITLGERGFDAAKASKSDIIYMRRNTSMVFQNFNLFKYKTALENVMEGMVTVQKKSKEDAKARATELLERVGLSDRMDYYPNKLSGGQQQRVAIARSLALEPKVMLLDEPTSALDPEMIAEVLSVIKNVAKDRMHAMIIVSHEMSFVYEISDKVIFLDEGEVLERGSPLDVFGSPQSERAKQFISRVNISNNYVI
ncbi:MAG: amino acid ABC transporter ATP-binding protein [Oscillospiraceae bacterium]|jgi:ABC-type polar amino acid transport system ATPase subunit|nr:amino acid ABC transporter ATP-binding protein [Oscillospiraceae bacterium]